MDGKNYVQGSSARSGSTKEIRLLSRCESGNLLHLYKLWTLYICMSVASHHPKTNKLLGTSPSPPSTLHYVFVYKNQCTTLAGQSCAT